MPGAHRDQNASTKIVVTGDVIINWFEASTPPPADSMSEEASAFKWQTFGGRRFFPVPGGAILLAKFIHRATGGRVLAPELRDFENIRDGQLLRAFASLKPFPCSQEDRRDGTVYRIKEYKGFAGPANGAAAALAVKDDDPEAGLIIIDDGGHGFRTQQKVWPSALQAGREPILLVKMGRPLGQGAFWTAVKESHADRMVVVVNADDLRASGVNLSRRLSWERTATDFVWDMGHNSDISGLTDCQHLVVRFGTDGAILRSRTRGVIQTTLFFDPSVGEDDFVRLHPGGMIGVGSAFTAGIAAQIVSQGFPGLADGVRQGILAARRLWKLGFGSELEKLDFPVDEMFQSDEKAHAIADVIVPDPDAGSHERRSWRILHDVLRDHLEAAAFRFAVSGSDPALDRVPAGEFGRLRTLDRAEIESYRSIQNLIAEYLEAGWARRPLSIAVFGAPGSGKSFGVREVAESVAPGEIVELDFNLSQFASTSDLSAAFHKVRDVVLEGKVPLVFFDEFDCDFEGQLGWLRFFLEPMQDGRFREGDAVHPIGRSIFVFAGGTAHSFSEFSRQPAVRGGTEGSRDNERSSEETFRSAKGPDFLSRLRGYIDIKGANPIDDDDKAYVVRRALMLRHLLEAKAPHLFDAGRKLSIDSGVLRAMIKVPEYKHGVRSMSAIIEMSMLRRRKSFERAALPSPEQLELHVDSQSFSRLLSRDVLHPGTRA